MAKVIRTFEDGEEPLQIAKLLISACLLGNRVRYDGQDLRVANERLHQWEKEGRCLAFCPEVAAGLPIPRPPAEIVGGDGEVVLASGAEVIDNTGKRLTAEFVRGARRALSLCQEHDITIAILAEFSPSCGSRMIYDGRFSNRKVAGTGVTTALLMKHGIRVFSQHDIDAALDAIG